MTDDQKLLIRRVQDLSELAKKYNTPRFSDFYDESEQVMIHNLQICPDGVWFGGNDDCARKMLGFFPDWWCDDFFSEFPIGVVYIKNKGRRELSHRDYLGTLMSLGLERKKVGDIAVLSDGAYIFLTQAAAEHILSCVNKVAGCGVECRLVNYKDVKMPEAKFQLKDCVVASLRLDAVVAGVCAMSRRVATEFIAGGKVSVNHIQQQRCDYQLKVGDLLSLRGYGRVEIADIGSKTRSDRLHITVKKFI